MRHSIFVITHGSPDATLTFRFTLRASGDPASSACDQAGPGTAPTMEGAYTARMGLSHQLLACNLV